MARKDLRTHLTSHYDFSINSQLNKKIYGCTPQEHMKLCPKLLTSRPNGVYLKTWINEITIHDCARPHCGMQYDLSEICPNNCGSTYYSTQREDHLVLCQNVREKCLYASTSGYPECTEGIARKDIHSHLALHHDFSVTNAYGENVPMLGITYNYIYC